MSEWRETTLSDICSDISYGYTASATQENIGAKFLRITDIVPDRINWDSVPFCKADIVTTEKYKLKNGDIVIARTGATTGYNKVIKNINFEAVYASYLIRYQIDKSQADPFYIGHILQSSNWYDYVDAIAGGSAQPGANAKQLGSFQILLPPLPEQKAIAAVLSSLDDKIDLLHRQNKTLEAMAETLFKQWFVVEAREEWEERPLGDFFEISSGKGLKKEQLVKNGIYPVLGANGEIGRTNDFLFNEKLLFTGRVGTLGNIFIVNNEKVWLSDNTLIFRNIRYFYFIYFVLKLARLANYNVGSTQPLIRQSDIKEIPIISPDSEKLNIFEVQSWQLFKKIKTNQTQIRTLETLRDNLLPKLMSGEVRVKLTPEETPCKPIMK
jgi:type I restriction enzyme S subunit